MRVMCIELHTGAATHAFLEWCKLSVNISTSTKKKKKKLRGQKEQFPLFTNIPYFGTIIYPAYKCLDDAYLEGIFCLQKCIVSKSPC